MEFLILLAVLTVFLVLAMTLKIHSTEGEDK